MAEKCSRLTFSSLKTTLLGRPPKLTKDSGQDETIITVGVNWMPFDNIVFKANYCDYDRGTDRFELGMGYVF